MINDIEKILFDEKELDKITTELAERINEDYKNSKKLVFVIILKGSVTFATDLMRKVNLPIELEFMKASSYGSGTVSSGNVKISLDLVRNHLNDTDLIVIEDIVDSGRTLASLTSLLRDRGAESVKTCSLLDKPSRREVNFKPDYIGRRIDDLFVVGYGLDYNERYRNLPYIGVLKKEIYTEG